MAVSMAMVEIFYKLVNNFKLLSKVVKTIVLLCVKVTL